MRQELKAEVKAEVMAEIAELQRQKQERPPVEISFKSDAETVHVSDASQSQYSDADSVNWDAETWDPVDHDEKAMEALRKLPMKELKVKCAKHGVNVQGFIEKEEYVRALWEHA